MAIIKLKDNTMFKIDEVRENDVFIENSMRKGIKIISSAKEKSKLRILENKFEEDYPEVFEEIFVYSNENDINILKKVLENLSNDILPPAGHNTPKQNYTKVGSILYEKFQEKTDDGLEPNYLWRIIIELGQKNYFE